MESPCVHIFFLFHVLLFLNVFIVVGGFKLCDFVMMVVKSVNLEICVFLDVCKGIRIMRNY